MRSAPIAPRLVINARRTRPTLAIRARLRFRAARLDRDLEACRPILPGSALALHAHRVNSAPQRQRLAEALRLLLDRSRAGGSLRTARIPLRRSQILDQEVLISEIITRLDTPTRIRGIARLRLLLVDGAGPLYVTGHGSLAAQLRGVLAAL